MARQYRVRLVKPKVQFALVVDQLEELFVGGFSAEVQQKYLATLGALVRCQRFSSLRFCGTISTLLFENLVPRRSSRSRVAGLS
jgi:hypothetical protein